MSDAVVGPPHGADAIPRPSPHDEVIADSGADRVGSGVRSGTRWMTLSFGAVQAIRLLAQVVLARILAPEHFGLMAMALVVMQFLDLFRDLGTRSAIVQRETISRGFLSSMFFVNLAMGLILAVGIAATAPLVSLAFGEPQLVPLLQVLALATLMTSAGLVQEALMHRHMRFRTLAVVQLVGAVGYGGVAVGLAVAGLGVWALVLSTVVSAALSTLAAWSLSPWRPGWHFSWSDPRAVAGYSLNISGAESAGYLLGVADRLIIGRALGSIMLGYWAMAGRVFVYPIQAVVHVLHQVLFPALARLEDDGERGRYYLRAVSVVAMVSLPAMAGLAVVARPFVDVVLGEQWLPAVPLIMLVAPVGALDAMMGTTGVLLKAIGRTDRMLRISLFSAAAVVASILLGVPWGVNGVAVAYAVAHLALLYPTFSISLRLIGLRFADFVRAVAPYVTATLAMVAATGLAVGMTTAASLAAWAVLLTGIAVGAAVYGGLMLTFRPAAVGDLAVLVPALPDRWARWLDRGARR